jgi:nicotinamide phosphoribosyltransferase
MSFKLNPLLNADSYKFNHINMYPKGVTEVYSNFTPRSVRHLNVPDKYKTNEIVWFGGQAVIKDMVDAWKEYFFSLDNVKVDAWQKTELDYFIEEFSRVIAPFAGANYSVKHLYKLHGVGYLPLEIKTLREGSRVPVGVPVMTVRNTEPEFFWLTNFIESYLSAELWKMSTTATIADYYRKIGNFWYEKTGANKGFLDFAFHDFSYRGMSGSMDAIKSGSGHLTSFKGSDTVPAIPYLEYHYSGKATFLAASVPATEHSIQTAFVENDLAYFNSILDAYPSDIVSIVADGYDYWSVLTNVLPQLKDTIMNRQPDAMGFAKTVIRPDSGDPVRIIAGYSVKEIRHKEDILFEEANFELVKLNDKYYEWEEVSDGDDITVELHKVELTDEEVKGSIQVLWELFGGTTNDKGYKLLDQHIGLIYGDSITLERAEEILKRLEAKGFAADNVVFGVGSYTYQYNTRDTLGFAMKATNITQNGVDIPLFKDPKTDNGTKKSAKGLLCVASYGELGKPASFALIDNVSRETEATGNLTILYRDGQFLKHETIAEIRERLAA